ncbi:MAG: ornithine cyclodeaminase family protein [Acidipila sp.]|nr:ornithine cyclodeaminase family protein [Acidipila sp.]
MPREVLLLREPEIRELLDPAACIDAVEKAFIAYSTGRAELPVVLHLHVPENHGEIHIKAGHLHGAAVYAVKIVSGFPGDAAQGVPAMNGMVVVFDANTGAPAAFLLDNGYITELRTAAAGSLAAKHLARREVRSVAVVGSGSQARYQIESLALVRSFREVRIWGRHRDRAERCAKDLATRFQGGHSGLAVGCQFAAAPSVREALAGADIIITVTSSREPLVGAEWLAPGSTVIAVGSDNPEKQELDVDVLARADRIVADSLPQCLRLGEIHHAVERGAIVKEKVAAEIGQIAAGLKPGRQSEAEIIVCDLTGVGVQDVAAAALVYQRAILAGRGEKIAL